MTVALCSDRDRATASMAHVRPTVNRAVCLKYVGRHRRPASDTKSSTPPNPSCACRPHNQLAAVAKLPIVLASKMVPVSHAAMTKTILWDKYTVMVLQLKWIVCSNLFRCCCRCPIPCLRRSTTVDHRVHPSTMAVPATRVAAQTIAKPRPQWRHVRNANAAAIVG